MTAEQWADCTCTRCGLTAQCTPWHDYYTIPEDVEALLCERCFRAHIAMPMRQILMPPGVPMTDDLDARIRERLDENYGDDWNGHVFAMDVALRAALGLHTMGNLASDCDCYDGLTECPTLRAVADALGLANGMGET